MDIPDVEFIAVSKRYQPRGTPLRSIASRWRGRAHVRDEPFWAVRDLTFSVAHGEVVGIIGSNGAGKSTILKLLSGITAPTTGEIRIYGRLAALIEIGSGFHPELTGRENVYLSGAILGMRRREIDEKLDRIIDFSGVGDFIDSPVKWYSSGMYVRLGFAIAAHLDPEVLLVDEVLAVGDEVFQEKCFRRVAELRRGGTTIIFISHDLAAIERLCSRALLVRAGEIISDGPADAVAARYRRWAAGQIDPAAERPPNLASSIRIADIELRSTADLPEAVGRTGFPLTTVVRFDASDPLTDLIFEVNYLSRGGNVLMCAQTTAFSGPMAVSRGEGLVEFSFDEVGLQPGVYSILATVSRGNGDLVDQFASPVRLTVEPGKNVRGYFFSPHSWRVRQPELTGRGGWNR